MRCHNLVTKASDKAKIVAGLLACLAAFVVGVHYARDRYILPKSVDTLAKFDQVMPKPERVEIIRQAGLAYIEVVAPLPSFPALPSGPPIYIFDANRKVVDWTLDVGDDDAFQERWRSAAYGQTISMPQALALTHSTVTSDKQK